MADFERSIALKLVGDRYLAVVPDDWRVEAAANGGYTAATVVSAMQSRLGASGQAPRSLSVHYLHPLLPGPAEIAVEIARAGRRLSTLRAEYRQANRITALALGTFGAPLPLPTPLWRTWERPPSPPPSAVAAIEGPVTAPYGTYWEQRPTIGSLPYSGSADTSIGGWVRSREPAALTAPLIAAMSDSFPPALLSRLEDRVGLVPTVDLTIHFRRALPPPGAAPGDFCFCRFETRTVADGYLEEDGAIWAEDGALLAQSRQLAILA